MINRHTTLARYQGHTVVIMEYGPETCQVRWVNDTRIGTATTTSLTEFAPAPPVDESEAYLAEFNAYEAAAEYRREHRWD